MIAIAHLKVGTRLGPAFAAVLALQLLTTGLGLRQMADQADHITSITELDEAKLKTLNEVSAHVGARAIAAGNLALLSDPAAQKADLERVRTAQVAIDQGLGRLAVLTQDADAGAARERRMLEQLRALEGRYLPIATRVVGLATTQKTDAAIKR